MTTDAEVQAAENARLERGLLPLPLVSRHGVEVVARYRPGRHQSLLGGDFYDVIECSDGSLFALIGDVAGHGPDEAALGVGLRIAWRTLVLAGVDPETILGSMHAVLVSERRAAEVFATVAMVRVQPQRGVATFWVAGHPEPLLVDGTTVRPGPDRPSSAGGSGGATGVALGVLDGAVWPGADTAVGPDTRLLLFTDGLTEGFDGRRPGERLGDTGLHAVLPRLLERGLTGAELVAALLDTVHDRDGGELTDDVAVLLLSWAGWR